MKKNRTEPKPLMEARFRAEARRLAGEMSENQKRFLRVATTRDAEGEPVGRLAG